MPTPRRFSMSSPSTTTEAEPLTFTLEGHRVSNGEPWEETFTLLDGDVLPGSHADLISAWSYDDQGNGGWRIGPICAFIGANLRADTTDADGKVATDDEVRWYVLTRDKDRRLDPDEMAAVMFWITGEKAGRPTGRRSISSDGPPPGNNGSEAAASSPDEQPTGSTPLG